MSCAGEHTWVLRVCLNNKHLITVLLQGPVAPPPLTLQQHVSHSAEQDQGTPHIQPLLHMTLLQLRTYVKQMEATSACGCSGLLDP